MENIEKTGAFYLGKVVDPSTRDVEDKLLMYDSKNLTTHAVCVGMTGSGKTGLGITIIEEAGIDQIPSILIDPKGDLTNLLLTFPNLSPQDFLPWIDEGEAKRKGLQPLAYAESVANDWKEGLSSWGEGAERIQKLKNSVDMAIYTPASKAGRQLSILSTFSAPSKEIRLDTEAMREKVLSTTSSLLGLLGINADPIKSREHILISTIFFQAWEKGNNLDLPALIQQVQNPPFNQIGTLNIDTFFPSKDRMALSISLNNLLASPGFQAWMEGEPLDIQNLLYTNQGKPKVAILSIAHLSDAERMFFVTLLLNEFISWMRRQPGTSSLRALLYMDEIFGYFPPSAMPPSKTPMLTLLKQARAYGIGVVLATQNPVDLDYKGLSNCGTWFIGKLQTDRDKSRVIEGLNAASNGELDTKTLDKMLGSIGKRIFLMRSIYEKEPVLFQTRWTLSYLRGPLTLTQIESLTEKPPLSSQAANEKILAKADASMSSSKPALPPAIAEFYLNQQGVHQAVHYQPSVAGFAKLHFVDAKYKIDTWEEVCILAPLDEGGKAIRWEDGIALTDGKKRLEKEPLPNSTYANLPPGLTQEKNYSEFQKTFSAWLYQNQVFTLYQAPEVGLTSKEGESEVDFRMRISLTLREKLDEEIKKLRNKYAEKIALLSDKIKRAQEKVAQKQQKAGMQWFETLISFGTALLGALLGRKITKGTITSAGTSIKRAGRIGKGSLETTAAEEELKNYQQQLEDLQTQMRSETDQYASTIDVNKIQLENITIRPRKGDIDVEKIAIAWK